MTHVMDLPATLAEIDAFRAALAEHFITFDPGDLDEKRLLFDAGEATKRGEPNIKVHVQGRGLADPGRQARHVVANHDHPPTGRCRPGNLGEAGSGTVGRPGIVTRPTLSLSPQGRGSG
jgi:hypothetical protein